MDGGGGGNPGPGPEQMVDSDADVEGAQRFRVRVQDRVQFVENLMVGKKTPVAEGRGVVKVLVEDKDLKVDRPLHERHEVI